MSEDEVNQSSDQQETVGSSNDDRIARLNAIADQTDADRADEFANVNDDGSTEPYAVVSEQTETEAAADNEEQPIADAENESSDSAEPKRYRIKVNGKELELTEAQLIERAQKIEAADEYLRQAAEARRKLEQIARPEVDEDELRRRQDEEDRALVRAIQVGTEEEATAALRKLREQTSARPSLSRDDVSRTIDERLAFNQAIEKFSTEYSDVWSDTILKKIALDRDAQLLKEGDQRSYWDRYASIGEEIRSWKQSIASAPKPAETTMATKAERKASAPKVPTTTASVKSKPVKVEEDDVDDSPSSVIASMAQRRGGPQWMRS
jgi:hypothetical protein